MLPLLRSSAIQTVARGKSYYRVERVAQTLSTFETFLLKLCPHPDSHPYRSKRCNPDIAAQGVRWENAERRAAETFLAPGIAYTDASTVSRKYVLVECRSNPVFFRMRKALMTRKNNDSSPMFPKNTSNGIPKIIFFAVSIPVVDHVQYIKHKAINVWVHFAGINH